MQTFIRSRAARLTAFALLLGASSLTQACEIWRDPYLGVWRSNCKISEFKEQFIFEGSFIESMRPRVRLRMPDLRIDKFKYWVSGTQIRIEADIVNDGAVNAPASDLAVTVDIGNPLNGMQAAQTIPFVARVPAINAGVTQRVAVGTISVPNNAQDWDLVLLGMNDPQTPTSAAWGMVLESNESNNTRMHTCRWFGPNPNATLRACN
jgi:hypothetical protein